MEIKINLFSLYIASIITLISFGVGNYELNLTINGDSTNYNINFIINVIVFITSYIVFNKKSKS